MAGKGEISVHVISYSFGLAMGMDCGSPKYEPWLDQTRLCSRSVPKRYDLGLHNACGAITNDAKTKHTKQLLVLHYIQKCMYVM